MPDPTSLTAPKAATAATASLDGLSKTRPGRGLVTDVIEVRDMPFVDGTPIRVGGFSGLVFDGWTAGGELEFTTHTDRGPNLESTRGKNGEKIRPFVWPAFQPEWVRFRYHPKTHVVQLINRTGLTNADGSKTTGLPNIPALASDVEETDEKNPRDGDREFEKDEIPVDAFGRAILPDPHGLDLESIRRDRDGTVWMSEEYRPSILHFTSSGRLLVRWIPERVDRKFGEPRLPAHFAKRRSNRGFEGVALRGGSVFGFLQTGLHGDHEFTRIIEMDKNSAKPVAEYAYEFDATPEGKGLVDKFGDAVAIGDGRFLVIEQNGATGAKGYHRIYEVDVRRATNLLKSAVRKLTPKHICGRAEAKKKCAVPIVKTLVADLMLTPALVDVDKIEGLDVIDANTLALISDNDFAVKGHVMPEKVPAKEADLKEAIRPFVVQTPTVFAIVKLARPLLLEPEK